MSYPITAEDVADLLSAIGRPDAAANVRHFTGVAPPVSWTAEIYAQDDELADLRGQLESLNGLLCKKCATQWEKIT